VILNPDNHHCRSIRLKGFDYSQSGAYFVTVCAENGESLFGEVQNGKMILNDAGRMIERVWNEMPMHYSGVDVDEFIGMPNHVHGIVIIVGATPRGCPENYGCPNETIKSVQAQVSGQAQGPAPTGSMSLGDVVHRFKSYTTACYRKGVRELMWQPFYGKLWQRYYYEHIIRDGNELTRIREYIIQNPLQWALDRENPSGI
jgi:putative transposase